MSSVTFKTLLGPLAAIGCTFTDRSIQPCNRSLRRNQMTNCVLGECDSDEIQRGSTTRCGNANTAGVRLTTQPRRTWSFLAAAHGPVLLVIDQAEDLYTTTGEHDPECTDDVRSVQASRAPGRSAAKSIK